MPQPPRPKPESTSALHVLPPPAAVELERSQRLTAALRTEIAQNRGGIDFSHYMERVLYAPGLGYYSAGHNPLGAAGDFITAPELSPLFGRCLARQCAQILSVLASGDAPADVLEVGGGSGALAAHILLELEAMDCLPRHYYFLELSGVLRAQQDTTLRRHAPHLYPRVRWLQHWPEPGFRGVILGNELLDAMPVQRFRVTQQGCRQLQVGWDGERFVWREQGADAAVEQRVASLSLPVGYESEIGLQAEAWIRSAAAVLETAVVLLIDYGFPRHEYYHAQRAQGTLMCHYRHHSHPDPLILPGLQDITAHIDFTAMALAAADADLRLLGYTSQADFLLAAGLLSLLEQERDAAAQFTLSQQVKKLTLPTEMGELFKVIAFGRNWDTPLLGFSLRDRRARL